MGLEAEGSSPSIHLLEKDVFKKIFNKENEIIFRDKKIMFNLELDYVPRKLIQYYFLLFFLLALRGLKMFAVPTLNKHWSILPLNIKRTIPNEMISLYQIPKVTKRKESFFTKPIVKTNKNFRYENRNLIPFFRNYLQFNSYSNGRFTLHPS